jgi:hypothetical protein
MTSRLTETVVDCSDPARLAEFWCAALGYVVVHENTEHPFIEIAPAKLPDTKVVEALRQRPGISSLLFVAAPDAKSVKNRLHLDLSPIDASREDEVARLEGLGATRVDIGQSGEEPWVVMADPEGNEFCVLRSLAPGHFRI